MIYNSIFTLLLVVAFEVVANVKAFCQIRDLDSICTMLEKISPEQAHLIIAMMQVSMDHYLEVNKRQYDKQNLSLADRKDRALSEATRTVGLYMDLYSEGFRRAYRENHLECTGIYFEELMQRQRVHRVGALDEMFDLMLESMYLKLKGTKHSIPGSESE